MTSHRKDRVAHLIQMELGRALVHRMKDPRIGFITITHVGMGADLKSARVFYSVLGDVKARESAQKGLDRAAGFLQHEIAVALKLRYTPKLTFVFDDTWEQSLKVERTLHELKQSKKESPSHG